MSGQLQVVFYFKYGPGRVLMVTLCFREDKQGLIQLVWRVPRAQVLLEDSKILLSWRFCARWSICRFAGWLWTLHTFHMHPMAGLCALVSRWITPHWVPIRTFLTATRIQTILWRVSHCKMRQSWLSRSVDFKRPVIARNDRIESKQHLGALRMQKLSCYTKISGLDRLRPVCREVL